MNLGYSRGVGVPCMPDNHPQQHLWRLFPWIITLLLRVMLGYVGMCEDLDLIEMAIFGLKFTTKPGAPTATWCNSQRWSIIFTVVSSQTLEMLIHGTSISYLL